MLIAELLRQIPEQESRQLEAERAIQRAMPLNFAMECFRWIGHYRDKPEDRRVLSDEGDLSLKAILTARIEEDDTKFPIFINYPEDAPSLYWFWIDGTSVAHVQQKLLFYFDTTPELIDKFLECYLGEAWDMESGLPRPADFRRDQYDSVCRMLPAEYIAKNLRLRYGNELDEPISYLPDDMLKSHRVAHQFMSIHQAVLSEQVSQENEISQISEPDKTNE